MSDFDDRLKKMLDRRSLDVPGSSVVSRQIIGRARRKRTFIVSLVAAAVLAGGITGTLWVAGDGNNQSDQIMPSSDSPSRSEALMDALHREEAAAEAAMKEMVAFCDGAKSLDSLQRHPTDEELDHLVEVAPAEIKEDVQILVSSAVEFRQGDQNAGASNEVQSAGDRFDQYREENCGGN